MAEQLIPADSTKPNADVHDAQIARHDAEARMDMYRFLATIYLQPPSEAIIRHFADKDVDDQLVSMFGESIVTPIHEMALAFDFRDDLAQLQQEYMGLFSAPAGQYVTPFEDVYRGLRLDGNQERGPLLGDRAVAVKIIYHSTGADLERTCTELPTHVGVELSFMNFLCEQEVKHLNQVEIEQDAEVEAGIYRQWQLKFLHEHLGDWFPQLRRAIESNARLPFYIQMAQLTQAFLDQDKDWLIQRFKSDLSARETSTPGQEQ